MNTYAEADPYVLGPFGEHVSLLRPHTSPLQLNSIARTLSRLPRFNAHTIGGIYSVGQHSIGASRLVPPQFAMEALLHDGEEFITGDLSSPVKSLCPDFKVLAKRIDRAIRQRYSLPAEMSPEVHLADLRMLATEKRDLVPYDYRSWAILDGIEPAPFRVRPQLHWYLTYRRFLWRFHEILEWER